MAMLNFRIEHQHIKKVSEFYAVEKSQNYLTAHFDFVTEDWDGITKTAIFRMGDRAYNVILVDDECLVPWEAIEEAGTLYVSVFGGDLITANSAAVNIHKSGYGPGSAPEPPTPSVYEQLTGMVQTAEQIAQSVRDDADAGKFDGPKGDSYTITSSDYEAIAQQTETLIAPTIANIAEVADRAETIARGRATGYVFDTYDDMTAWIPSHTAELNIGDNLYIRALDVPDYWWAGTEPLQLEAEKVDLTEYVKNTDYATTAQGGLIKVSASYGSRMVGSGVIAAMVDSYATYLTRSTSAFVGKGTLENVLANYQPIITPITQSAYEALTDKSGWYVVTGD